MDAAHLIGVADAVEAGDDQAGPLADLRELGLDRRQARGLGLSCRPASESSLSSSAPSGWSSSSATRSPSSQTPSVSALLIVAGQGDGDARSHAAQGTQAALEHELRSADLELGEVAAADPGLCGELRLSQAPGRANPGNRPPEISGAADGLDARTIAFNRICSHIQTLADRVVIVRISRFRIGRCTVS